MSAPPAISSPSGPQGPCPSGGTGPPCTTSPLSAKQARALAIASTTAVDAVRGETRPTETHALLCSTSVAVGDDVRKDAMLQLKACRSGSTNSHSRTSRPPVLDSLAEQLFEVS